MRLKKIVLLSVIALIVLIILIIAYLLYTKNSNIVKIENFSSSLSLSYKQNEEFVRFIDGIKDLRVAGKLGNVRNLKRISKVVMIVTDKAIPAEDNMPLAAIQMTIDSQKSKEDTLVLSLIVDNDKMKKFSDKQLSDQVFIDSLSIIYNLTHHQLSYSEKNKEINYIIRNFYRKSANPFRVIRK